MCAASTSAGATSCSVVNLICLTRTENGSGLSGSHCVGIPCCALFLARSASNCLLLWVRVAYGACAVSPIGLWSVVVIGVGMSFRMSCVVVRADVKMKSILLGFCFGACPGHGNRVGPVSANVVGTFRPKSARRERTGSLRSWSVGRSIVPVYLPTSPGVCISCTLQSPPPRTNDPGEESCMSFRSEWKLATVSSKEDWPWEAKGGR